MWKRACDKAEMCIAEAKEYNKQRYEKTHKEPEFIEGDQVLASTLTIIVLIMKNLVEVRLPKEFSTKHPALPMSLVKLYSQTGDNKFPSRNKKHTQQEIVEGEDPPGPVENIITASKSRLNWKDHRQYLVIFKHQTANKDRWLEEDAIPDGKIHPIRFRASRRDEKSHQ
ncbi:hypothetical protein O181_091017 [Austropuccinia psidii MF-1]|uniref:Chromo domain-containing protein n=1 Tax=Austropuccinia psidii MF-1 TaxID=1389203 RepID=A0A9Q3P875_9BASI|nr:hypothetical protein [Austropuccinia psidii MF-1]